MAQPAGPKSLFFPGFGVTSLASSPTILTSIEWDADGPGPIPPRVYVGGTFTASAPFSLRGVACLENGGWIPLAPATQPTAQGINGTVNRLATYDPDGAGPQRELLIVAGRFNQTISNGPFVDRVNIITWDGVQWSGLVPSLGNSNLAVHAVVSFDTDGDGPEPPTLFATLANSNLAGSPLPETGVYMLNLATNTWTQLGGTMSLGGGGGVVGRDLCVFDPDGPGVGLPPSLYVGGNFTSIGGTPVNFVGRWDASTSSWVNAGTNLFSQVYDLDVSIPLPGSSVERLYAASSVSNPGSGDSSAGGVVTSDGLGTWGQPVFSPDQPPNQSARCLATIDPDGSGPLGRMLYIGGTSTTGPNAARSHIVRFDGMGYQAVTPTDITSLGMVTVLTMTPVASDPLGGTPAPTIHFGGQFNTGRVRGLRAAGTTTSIDPNNPNNRVNALISADLDGAGPSGPSLIAAGSFSSVGNESQARNIVSWDGFRFTRVSGGTTLPITCATLFGEAGFFSGMPAITVGGDFTSVIGPTGTGFSAVRVGRWNPSDGFPGQFGTGFMSVPLSLVAHDIDGPGPTAPFLFACGGTIPLLSGPSGSGTIARFGFGTWTVASPPGQPTFSSVPALHSIDPDGSGPLPAELFASVLDQAPPLRGLWRWTGGTTWVQETSLPITAMAAWDEDGDGPRPTSVYCGVSYLFSAPGPLLYKRTSAGVFEAVPGLDTAYTQSSQPHVASLTVYDPDGSAPIRAGLYLSGTFGTSCQTCSRHLLRYDAPASPGGMGTFSSFGSGLLDTTILFTIMQRPMHVVDTDFAGPLGSTLFIGGTFSAASDVASSRIAAHRIDAEDQLVTVDASSPRTVVVTAGADVTLPVIASSGTPLRYAWRRGLIARTDGGRFSGATTAAFTITDVLRSDAGDYTAIVTNDWNHVAYVVVTLVVRCPADFNNSGGVQTTQDLFDYISAWIALDPAADFNGIGGVTVQDLFDFVTAWQEPCE
jgi:hypothetical protein